MKTVSYWLGLGTLAFMPLCASAQSSGVHVWGAGNASCGQWLEETKRESARAQHTDWVLGFLTAFNYYNPKRQVTPPDRASVSAWIDKHCRDNPLHREFMAPAALLEELGGPKSAHQWKR